jgi:hypothetical protein
MNDPSYAADGRLPPRLYEYMLAGLLLFAGAAAVTGYHVYHGFVTEEMARDRAYWGIGLPFVGVASGIYLFALGWQRGDVGSALRMSLWLSLGALGIIIAVLGALALKRQLGAFAHHNGARRRSPGLWRSGWALGGSDDGYYEDSYMPGEVLFGKDEERRDPGPDPLTVHCRTCGELFTPSPPRAACPYCGQDALAG